MQYLLASSKKTNNSKVYTNQNYYVYIQALLRTVQAYSGFSKGDWKCDHCSTESRHEVINAKLAKFEAEIEDIKASEPAELEKLIRKMSCTLHENHYWILDVKRRLIDIYGNKEGFELYKLPKVNF